MSGGLLAVFDMPEPECVCRLRELRMAGLLLLGPKHPLMQAVATAIENRDALIAALAELDRLPALPRRRVLSALAAVIPA
jgi:hypothetical protein